MLFSLTAIYILLPIDPKLTPKQRKAVDLGLNTKYYMQLVFVHIPFTLCIAWVTVVMVLNFFVFTTAPPINYSSNIEGWSIIMQSAISAVTLLVLFFKLDVIYGAVITWSLIAIAVHQRDHEYVCFTAGLLSGAIGVFTIITLLYRLIFNWYLPLNGGRYQLVKSNSQRPFTTMSPVKEDLVGESSNLTSTTTK